MEKIDKKKTSSKDSYLENSSNNRYIFNCVVNNRKH